MNVLVYITVPDRTLARKIARELVAQGLCAGVNMAGPVESVYMWDGAVREAAEWLLFCQSQSCGFSRLKEVVLAIHPHVVPCITAWELKDGHAPFMRWISENSRGGQCA